MAYCFYEEFHKCRKPSASEVLSRVDCRPATLVAGDVYNILGIIIGAGPALPLYGPTTPGLVSPGFSGNITR